jgi:hypothetical protein
MHPFLRSGLILCLSSATSFGADSAKGFTTANLNIGYMPQEELGERVSVEELGSYFKRLEAVCVAFFADTITPENFDVVVAVKPGKRTKVWFVSSRPPAERRDDLRAKLEAVVPPVLRGRPIAFAIQGRIAGGATEAKRHEAPSPTPAEWEEAITKLPEPTTFDGLLPRIWPDAPGEEAMIAAALPAGFVMQTLAPTGGHIPRPKDWFYLEGHQGASWMWTISREDISKGASYTTGVRIQTFIGVKEKTGQSPKEFVQQFLTRKKKDATRVIETCAERNQGMFTRVCVQTEEGPYRILYSLFWGNDIDMVAITTSGTMKELWETYSPIFDQMSAFELIDMKRFGK